MRFSPFSRKPKEEKSEDADKEALPVERAEDRRGAGAAENAGDLHNIKGASGLTPLIDNLSAVLDRDSKNNSGPGSLSLNHATTRKLTGLEALHASSKKPNSYNRHSIQTDNNGDIFLSTASASNGEIQVDVAGIQADIDEQKGELEKDMDLLEKMCNDIEARLEDALAENSQLKSLTKFQEAELMEVCDSADRLSTENETLKKEKTSLNKRIAELSLSPSVQQNIASMQTEVETMNKTLLADNTELLDRLDEAAENIRIMQEKLAETETTLVALQQRNEHLETTNNDIDARYERQIKSLQQEADESDAIRRKLHDTIQELRGNIRVVCRVRPELGDSSTATSTLTYPGSPQLRGRALSLREDLVGGGQQLYEFDAVFSADASQETCYVEISPYVQSTMDGRNACIFSYGQSGSGKTYTMLGTATNPGMIPKALDQVFAERGKLAERGWKTTVECSLIEIYNESVRDLLVESNPMSPASMPIRHSTKGAEVDGARVVVVDDVDDVTTLMSEATKRRATGKTSINDTSSRSHAVFTMTVLSTRTNDQEEQESMDGTLVMIDLAGSERLNRSGSTGERLKETTSINKSLSALGDVIAALVSGAPHVPYRNSKLTYLLQPALQSGRAVMFLNLSPAEADMPESVCSLRFGEKVNRSIIAASKRRVTQSKAHI